MLAPHVPRRRSNQHATEPLPTALGLHGAHEHDEGRPPGSLAELRCAGPAHLYFFHPLSGIHMVAGCAADPDYGRGGGWGGGNQSGRERDEQAGATGSGLRQPLLDGVHDVMQRKAGQLHSPHEQHDQAGLAYRATNMKRSRIRHPEDHPEDHPEHHPEDHPEEEDEAAWGALLLRPPRLLAALCVVLFLAGSAGASADAFDPERITGVWIRTRRSEDDALRRAAIEKVTQPMSFAIRGLARAVMTRSIRPAERYVIRPAEVGLSIRADDEEPVTALLNGRLDPDPDARVRSRLLADGFIQTWQEGRGEVGDGDGDGNHGTTTWRVDANDGLLGVTVTVHDERFPHPLVYTTTYRRSDDAGSAVPSSRAPCPAPRHGRADPEDRDREDSPTPLPDRWASFILFSRCPIDAALLAAFLRLSGGSDRPRRGLLQGPKQDLTQGL